MAEVSAVQLGINGKVLRNTGTWGSPTWLPINLVRDVTHAMPWNMAPVDIRATAAALEAKTRIKPSGTITIKADPADAGYQALFDAAVSRNPIDLMIIDGPLTQEGCKGVRGYMNINWDGQNQEIDGVIYTSFTYSTAYHNDGYPAYVELGAASTPTFTQW